MRQRSFVERPFGGSGWAFLFGRHLCGPTIKHDLPQPDGTYKIFGTKIFITYGEHDMAPNIVHLVLARVSGA
ncbi:MAG: hypothetical protein ABIP89_20045, partial [Polyangiaceae bacterium]